MGDRIDYRDGGWIVPDRPVIPFIEGDGTGPDIWRAARRVFDAAVNKASQGKRRIDWLEILAGEKAFKETGNWLPEATLDAIRQHRVAIKGPLTTPVGGGSARSTSPCASCSICTPASARCATSRGCRARCGSRRSSTS